MNAITMKLENRQLPIQASREKSRESVVGKKCKHNRKKSLPANIDKDALQSSHGLGRKSAETVIDCNDFNSNYAVDLNLTKKVRTKKVSLKSNDKMLTESEKMQNRLQQYLSNEVKEKVSSILNEIRALSDVEKLYLYLQLPTGSTFEADPLKQKSQNPLGKKADEEGLTAVTWIQSHLEEDPDVSLPKQEVYEEYQLFCRHSNTDPLCAADFGKVMKQIFPSVKPRRLGTRGNSRYCYSGLRKKVDVKPPKLPDLNSDNCDTSEEKGITEITTAACHLIFEWAEKLLGIKFTSLKELAAYLLENMCVDNRSVAAFKILLDSSPQLLEKGLSNCEGGVKKSEAQIHLQRKIQEKELIKEQKKKLQEHRSNLVGLSKGKSSALKKKGLKSKKTRLMSLPADLPNFSLDKESSDILVKSQDENASENILNQQRKTLETQIKEEDCDIETLISHENSLKHNLDSAAICSSPSKNTSPAGRLEIEDGIKNKNKILISQSKTPVCIAQNLPGIIIVPSLSQLTDIGKQNVAAPKYKRIQPKPLRGESFSTVARSRAGSVGSTTLIKPKSKTNDGRRSSHARLQSDCSEESNEDNSPKTNSTTPNVKIVSLKPSPQINSSKKSNFITPQDIVSEKPKDCVSDFSAQVSADPKILPENSLEDKTNQNIELIFKSVESEKYVDIIRVSSEENNAMKRHLSENNYYKDNKRPHLDISITDAVSESASLNKSASNLMQQSQTNQIPVFSSEVCVHEIEGDALNDYFRGANSSVSIVTPLQEERNKELEVDNGQLSCNNKVKQLSQLRMLLEQNLPRAISKTPTVNSLQNQLVSNTSSLVLCDSVLLPQTVKTSDITAKAPFSNRIQEENKSINSIFNGQINSVNSETFQSVQNSSQIESIEKLFSAGESIVNGNIPEHNEILSDPNFFFNSAKNNANEIDINIQAGFSDLNQDSETNGILLPSNEISDIETIHQISNTLHSSRVSTYTQVPSVPQSPNTRRRAFNFTPISPRHTPIPINPDGINVSGTSALSSPVPNQYPRNMMSTAVGPSQPPSNAGSPFVSPRSTPVHFCRSRHSSGQSTYSTSRHTPFQNFDSGVSSVSTSPFISPQTTPVPVSRLRHNSSHGLSKTVTFCSVNSPQVINSQISTSTIGHLRSRHSSGPGGPHITGNVCSSRSAPLSPLVSEHCLPSTFMFPSGNEVRSRHNSGSNTTPLSPVSEQASSSSSCTSNLPDLSSVNEGTSMSHSFLNDGAGDLLISANPATFKQVRQRHASSSVIYNKPSLALKDTFSREIQNLLKNSQANGASDILLSNRSQSVPLHQMIEYCFLSPPVEDACPKSHPTTPVINQMFSFPLLSSSQETSDISLATDIQNRDKTLVQANQMEWAGLETTGDLEMSNARRNITTLLDPPLGDDLQTTLEDLRDCDTDFSKFAQELELSQNDEGSL